MPSHEPYNIVFIMSDDHARQQISAYRPDIPVKTPNIDRIANNGVRMDNCFCSNSICAPSRAVILTGNYNHLNGVRLLADGLDGRLPNVAKVLQKNGYQTALIGKWHLGTEPEHLPTGFDHFEVFDGDGGQGEYYNPSFVSNGGVSHREEGYATELVTEKSLDWLRARDPEKPFLLLCHHKAPHRNWQPAPKYQNAYDDIIFPHPENYHDDFATRGAAAREAFMDIDTMVPNDFKLKELPEFSSDEERRDWKFQHYMRDYMACISSVDDSVGEILDYLESEGLAEKTLLIYTSDQGFYTGEHGWFDKRFMYEESQCMPFVAQLPGQIPAGSVSEEMILNIDFAPTWLDYAGVDGSELPHQGRSVRDIFEGQPDARGYDAVYYRYWDYPGQHLVFPHFGIRTRDHKLIRFEDPNPAPGVDPVYWELYDLREDPMEMNNLYPQMADSELVAELKEALWQLKAYYLDVEKDFTPSPTDH